MYHNINLTSVTYEDVATEKLQHRRFQPAYSGLTTVVREKPSNSLYCQKLESLTYILPLILWVYLY